MVRFWLRLVQSESFFYDQSNYQYTTWARTRSYSYFELKGWKKDMFGHSVYKCTTKVSPK